MNGWSYHELFRRQIEGVPDNNTIQCVDEKMRISFWQIPEDLLLKHENQINKVCK